MPLRTQLCPLKFGANSAAVRDALYCNYCHAQIQEEPVNMDVVLKAPVCAKCAAEKYQ